MTIAETKFESTRANVILVTSLREKQYLQSINRIIDIEFSVFIEQSIILRREMSGNKSFANSGRNGPPAKKIK